MKVRDLLDSKGRDIVSIDVDSSVDDAIRSMNARKISAIMVTEQGKTVGIFTERDVVRSYINSGGKSFKESKVRDAMVTNLIVAVPDDELGDISSIMVEKNIRHLPVLHNGRVIGMLSIRDIIQTQVKKLTSDLHYLREYIVGYGGPLSRLPPVLYSRGGERRSPPLTALPLRPPWSAQRWSSPFFSLQKWNRVLLLMAA